MFRGSADKLEVIKQGPRFPPALRLTPEAVRVVHCPKGV